MKHSPNKEYKILKERFGDKLEDVLMFALEVDSWPYDIYEYVDQFGIQRELNIRQYLLSILMKCKDEGQNSTESYYDTHIA
jgi:hypothetical protein